MGLDEEFLAVAHIKSTYLYHHLAPTEKTFTFPAPSSPKVYVFGFFLPMLSTMNYMLALAHPGLADVMLSGVIKIFQCISGGGWG